MMSKNMYSMTGLLIAVTLLIVINILANLVFKSARIDLTENKLYTLSDGTKNILSKLEDPITLRFFFSEKLAADIPSIAIYARRVRDLLEEFTAISKGNLDLIITDPEPFTDAEDQAVQYGLQGVPVDSTGSPLYFGLVGSSSTDLEKVIPFFQMDKEESLEYDIVKLIHELTNPKKKIVSIMSSLPIEGAVSPRAMVMPSPDNQEWMVVEALRNSFDVNFIDMESDVIPDNTDVLLVIHPKNLQQSTLYAIDQFVLNGGRTMVFVDPHSESEVPPHDPQNPMASMQAARNSDLKKLFESWGIELVDNKVVGDINSAMRVTYNVNQRPQPVDYVAWMQLNKDSFNNKDFVTSELTQINMATAGRLKVRDGATTEISPLIETSSSAMELDKRHFQFSPDPVALLQQYRKGDEKMLLAARISGKVKTAFPDGAPAADSDSAKDEKSKNNHTAESNGNINVIVVADTDMLADRFWVNIQNFFGQRIAVPRANNGVFLVNAIDNLSGSNDLISLRSRGKSARPFTRVEEIQRNAEQQFRDKEKSLQDKLRNTESKLAQLQKAKNEKGSSGAMIITPEQQQEIEKFRQEKVKTRKELRNVQHELRKNIESLGSTIKFINIGLIPILIILFAVGASYYRHHSGNKSVA